MVASTAIFLFGWGGDVIARIPSVPAVGRPVLDGERHLPFAIAEADLLKWHGLAKLKIYPRGPHRKFDLGL